MTILCSDGSSHVQSRIICNLENPHNQCRLQCYFEIREYILSKHILLLIKDLYLDATIAQISACVQCIQRFLQGVCVRNEGLEIEDTTTETLQARWPGIAVAVDELEIDLPFVSTC
jgi:hypothetical protein